MKILTALAIILCSLAAHASQFQCSDGSVFTPVSRMSFYLNDRLVKVAMTDPVETCAQNPDSIFATFAIIQETDGSRRVSIWNCAEKNGLPSEYIHCTQQALSGLVWFAPKQTVKKPAPKLKRLKHL